VFDISKKILNDYTALESKNISIFNYI